MPTLPDVGRLGRGPYAGRGGHRSGWPYAARRTRPRCLRGVRGRPRCWVRRLGRGHCEGGQRAAPGRWRPGPGDRRGPRVAGYRPERHRPGVVARSAAWYRRSCPECDESCQRQRGRQGAAVEPDHRSTHRPTHVTDQSVQAPRRWLKRAGSPHPVQRENGAIRLRRSSTCPPRSSTPTASSSRTAAARSSTRKPTTGPVEKCSWSWSPRAEHLEGASLGELEGDEVGLLLAGGQAEDRLEECPQGRVLACPGAYPTNALDPHPCRSPAQVLGVRDPATSQLAVLGLAWAGQAQLGDGDTAQGGVELPAATAAATMAAFFQS
jgi:hypothetical protein